MLRLGLSVMELGSSGELCSSTGSGLGLRSTEPGSFFRELGSRVKLCFWVSRLGLLSLELGSKGELGSGRELGSSRELGSGGELGSREGLTMPSRELCSGEGGSPVWVELGSLVARPGFELGLDVESSPDGAGLAPTVSSVTETICG